MTNKRAKPEEIVTKRRQVEDLVGQGMQRTDAIRQISVTEQTYYRWRKTTVAWVQNSARNSKAY